MTVEIQQCANFISSATKLITNNGLTIETGSDFSALEFFIRKQSERSALTSMFASSNNNLGEDTGFWIIGRSKNGELVHTQAIRLFDLGENSLASFMNSRFHEFTPKSWQVDRIHSNYQAASGSQQISGTVCYHGEFWLKGGVGGCRGDGLTVIFARIAIIISLMKWSPDFIFALMHSRTICKGLAAKAGFMHTEQNNLFWKIPGQDESLEAWTAWLSRDDIRHLLNIPPEILSRQLTSNKSHGKSNVAA